MDKSYISTHDLSIGYKADRPLATDLNLNLYAGAVTSLIGSNGIGKSTLLRTLAGNIYPLHGKIHIMGTPLSEITKRNLATRLAVVNTGKGMAGGLTVKQFVELGRQPYTGLLGIMCAEDSEICHKSMSDCGILFKKDDCIATLSDGERQKAMIARALAQDTPVIYLDEPFSFLDPAARLEIMMMLKHIARVKNKAVLLTCHDVALSLRMASRLWLFTQKKTVLDMSPDEAISSGALNSLYQSKSVIFSEKFGDFIVNDNSVR